MGYGPMTGRCMGPCGAGMGYGRGFIARRFFTREEETELDIGEVIVFQSTFRSEPIIHRIVQRSVCKN